MGTYSIYTLVSMHGIALILGYYFGHIFKPGVNPNPENKLASILILFMALALPLGTTALFVGFCVGNRVAEEESEDEQADAITSLINETAKVKADV